MSTGVKLNPRLFTPDLLVFLFGFLLTAALYARRIPGSIVLGMAGSVLLALLLRVLLLSDLSLPLPADWREARLLTDFSWPDSFFALPPSLEPTLLQMDLRGALSYTMIPFVLILLFMDIFDTTGTLIGVSEEAGLLREGKLPRGNRVFLSDALGTVLGALLGTSTVTSYIESAAGVEQGGRTGLTALTVAGLFLLALFLFPLVEVVAGYPPLTAPALVLVGSLMMHNAARIHWKDPSEAIPSFLTLAGIPLFFSIGDGLAMGLVAHPVVKLLAGKREEVTAPGVVLAAILFLYFLFLKPVTG